MGVRNIMVSEGASQREAPSLGLHIRRPDVGVIPVYRNCVSCINTSRGVYSCLKGADLAQVEEEFVSTLR